MNLNSINLKLIIGIFYLIIISIGLYFLFSAIDVKDLMSYEFIRANKEIILSPILQQLIFVFVSLKILDQPDGSFFSCVNEKLNSRRKSKEDVKLKLSPTEQQYAAQIKHSGLQL